jgi:dTDP-4-dehydrorhamnose 3,5-epimerase
MDMNNSTLPGQRDRQTVTPAGDRLEKLIHGVAVRQAVTQEDERGEVTEIFSTAWGFSDAPVPYVYQALLRPGKIKGWVYHEAQEDRLFVSLGFLKLVLCDLRADSPTHRMVNEIVMTERSRKLVVIPQRVAHAVQNIGQVDALFTNLPSRPYDHANPDKFRLPLGTDLIPYTFDGRLGW